MKKKNAASLIMVLLLLTVILILGSTMIFLNDISGKMHKVQRENDKAFYLCDSTREEIELILVDYFKNISSYRRDTFINDFDNKSISLNKSNQDDIDILDHNIHTITENDDTVVIKFEIMDANYENGWPRNLIDSHINISISYNTKEKNRTILLKGFVQKKDSYYEFKTLSFDLI